MFRHALLAAVLAVSSISVAQPARADFRDGNRLYADCTVREGASTYYQDKAYCLAYIVGANDGIESGLVLAEVYTEIDDLQRPYCLPDNVTAGQLTDVVVAYLRKNPAERHLAGSIVVFAALTQAFPCR